MSENSTYPAAKPLGPGDPFGPQYPDLGPGVAKFRRMAFGGIAAMDRTIRRAYGEAVESAIKAKQRSSLLSGAAAPPPLIKDVGAYLRAKQRNALLACPGVEPLLGRIDIGDARPDWIITGGESGAGFRPLDMDAVRFMRDQCAANGIAFHHKQNGGFRGKDAGCLIDGVEHKHFPPALAA
jgi:Protein of unknown function (DUF5131)